MYLLDANIWLERLLNQAKATEVKQLLDAVKSSQLAVSDFALHSVCNILGRGKRLALLDRFITDLFVEGQVTALSIPAAETKSVTAAMEAQRLDFDDAYQYVIAKGENLTLVSFDSDFDHTDLQRWTPAQVLASLRPPRPA
jgi:hypothetical protein